METKQSSRSLERTNKTATQILIIDMVIMLIFALAQMLKGNMTVIHFIVLLVLAVGPVAACIFYMRKDKETDMIRHVLAIGFAVFYTMFLFTANCGAVYTFVIPIMIAATMYHDVRYFKMVNFGVMLESLVAAILGFVSHGKFGYLGPEATNAQIFTMIVVCIACLQTAWTTQKNEEQEVHKLDDAKEEAEQALTNVSSLKETLEQGVLEVHNQLELLKDAASNTQTAMEEVTAGATDTANAVSSQSEQTAEIQSMVDLVSQAVTNILDNMNKTMDALSQGNQNMSALTAEVDVSVKNSEEAATKLELLDGYMKEMNSIVEIISSITSQTSLLALNASIEAARAGEAGRGFAVVASEISGMATQTKDATVHITDLIGNVSTAITEVVAVIRQMIDGISQEKQTAMDTSGSFEEISKSTVAIKEHVEGLVSNVEDLKVANEGISNSIQTISAISQEVSAHANETLEAETKNEQILNDITNLMEEIAAQGNC